MCRRYRDDARICERSSARSFLSSLVVRRSGMPGSVPRRRRRSRSRRFSQRIRAERLPRLHLRSTHSGLGDSRCSASAATPYTPFVWLA